MSFIVREIILFKGYNDDKRRSIVSVRSSVRNFAWHVFSWWSNGSRSHIQVINAITKFLRCDIKVS